MLSIHLREIMQNVLDGSQWIIELEEYIVPHLPRFIQDPASADSDAIAALELAFVEFSKSHMDEDRFRMSVSEILLEHPSVWVSYPIEVSSTASSNSDTQSGNLASWPSKVEYFIEVV